MTLLWLVNVPLLQQRTVRATHVTKMMQLSGMTAPAVIIPARETVDSPAMI